MQSLSYRPDIDGLRAIAVLSVLGFHAFPHLIKGGFVGVDIFFVISGFLISTLIFENLEKNTFSFKEFYKKRMKRIFPALILILVFCLILGWFALFPMEYQQLGKHVSGGAGFVSNLLLWQESGYFDPSSETKPLLHLWSLGIEEQFYILWPLLVCIAWKRQFNILALTLLIVLLSFVLNLNGIASNTVATFYSPQTRFWELLSGSGLAYFLLYKTKNVDQVLAKIGKSGLSIIGFVLILLGLCIFTKATLFPGYWALLPVLGAVFLVFAGKDGWVNRVILSHPAMVWIGLISYPLYLWHWPLLSFSYIMVGEYPNKFIRIACFILSFVLAWLTYQFVEKPLRFGLLSARGQLTFLSLPTLMLGLAFAGGIIYQHNGFAPRYAELSKANELLAVPTSIAPPSFVTTKFYPSLNGLLSFLSKDREADICFIGDSHTLHYLRSIWAKFPSQSVLAIVEPLCLPFSSNRLLDCGACKEKYQKVIAFLQNNQSIKTIYLSSYWSFLMTGELVFHDGWRAPVSLEEKDAQSFLDNARYFLKAALTTGKEIVFLKDVPDLTFNINGCFHARPLNMPFIQYNKACSMYQRDFQSRMKAYDLVIDQLLQEFPQVKVYDPRPLFCKEGKCMARDDTYPYYFNGDHLNLYGADIVMKDMREKLKA